jgi:uncharacterized protein YrzB (UPF0473 family)
MNEMNERKTITVKNMDGVMEEMELVNSFGINELNKNFVIFSKNEEDSEGLSKIYISEVVEDPVGSGIYKLVGISDETIWEKVKMAMKEIVEG